MNKINFTIDGKACTAEPGQTIYEAVKANGIYIPVLCYYEGLVPAGSCRICTVRVNGRYMASCTQPLAEGMAVETTAADLEDMRRATIEMLFVEGNHLCPSCEKSGNCELQALAYRYQILVPRFPYLFPKREVEPAAPKILIEHNRCILCRRCVRGIKTPDGRKIFAIQNRSRKSRIALDPALGAELTDELARKAMDICPVGALLRKEVGFVVPIGRRKYDKVPIGSDAAARPEVKS
jgi:[NiFe] hydrogenase diaphorase moiety small subunit